MQNADNTDDLQKAVLAVEAAISSNNPKSAFNYFTPEGYTLFANLMTKNGKVTLVGKAQSHNFIIADATSSEEPQTSNDRSATARRSWKNWFTDSTPNRER